MQNHPFNSVMRLAVAMGWLWLATALGWSAAPLDLNSPFPKLALIRGKTGEIEKREIQKVRMVDGMLEMEKTEGGAAVFPVQDVVAILPVLPPGEDQGSVEQIEAAMRLLRGLSPELARQAGFEEDQLENWKSLKNRLAEIEKQRKEQERSRRYASSEREFQDWIAQAGELRKPRTEKELTDLKRSGEALAQKNPDQNEAIVDALAALSQVQPKEKGEPLPELRRLNEVQPKLTPDDLLGWLVGGILILSFFALLFGLAFLSSSLTRFKEGAPLGGIVFGLFALALLGGLIWTWLPARVTGQTVTPRLDPKMEELAIYLKNRARPVCFLPPKRFLFSAEEWRSGLMGYLSASEEPEGFFRVKMKEGALWLAQGVWIWRQPLTALGIPVPFSLTLEGKNPDFNDWENPTVTGVYLGRWLLPRAMASLVKDSASSIWQAGLSSAGLAGVKLGQDERGMIFVSVPAGGVKPKYEFAKGEERKGSAYQREITAEALAQAFMENKGKEFQGKFVVIEGVVEKISSGSEYSGGPVASQDEGSLNPQKAPAKIKEDAFDVFYLRGADSYGYRKDPLLIKLVIKSPGVFVMDSYGDIYAGPRANIVKETALIKKGYRVKFLNEGRVQSDQIKNNEIEVYGITVGMNGEGLECFDPATKSLK